MWDFYNECTTNLNFHDTAFTNENKTYHPQVTEYLIEASIVTAFNNSFL